MFVGVHRDIDGEGTRGRQSFAIIGNERIGKRAYIHDPNRKWLGRPRPGENADDHIARKIHIRRGLMRMMLRPKMNPLTVIMDHHLAGMRDGRVRTLPFEGFWRSRWRNENVWNGVEQERRGRPVNRCAAFGGAFVFGAGFFFSFFIGGGGGTSRFTGRGGSIF